MKILIGELVFCLILIIYVLFAQLDTSEALNLLSWPKTPSAHKAPAGLCWQVLSPPPKKKKKEKKLYGDLAPILSFYKAEEDTRL